MALGDLLGLPARGAFGPGRGIGRAGWLVQASERWTQEDLVTDREWG